MIFTSADGGTVVTLPGAQFAKALPEIEHHQNMQQAEDGTEYVYNRAVNKWYYELEFNLSESQRSALRSFFKTTTQFAASTFKITPDSPLDLGKGAGTQVTDCRLLSSSFPEVPTAPGRYRVSIVVTTKSTGTSNPA